MSVAGHVDGVEKLSGQKLVNQVSESTETFRQVLHDHVQLDVKKLVVWVVNSGSEPLKLNLSFLLS